MGENCYGMAALLPALDNVKFSVGRYARLLARVNGYTPGVCFKE